MKADVLILQIIWTVLSLLGLSTNILLLIAVYRRRKSSNLTIFSIFVADISVSDIFSCISVWLNMPSIHLFDFFGLSAYEIYGIARYFPISVCYALHAIYDHITGNIPLVIIISFCLKYFSMVRKQPPRWVAVLLIVLAYVPSAVYLIIFPSFINPLPEDSSNLKLIWFNRSLISVKIVRFIFIALWITTVISAFIFRYLILKELGKLAPNMSDKTKKMHRTVVLCLTLQAMTPLITLGVAVALFMESWHTESPLLGSLRFLLGSLMPPLHGAVPLFFITPYRRAIFGGKVESVGGTFDSGKKTASFFIEQ